MQPFMDPELFKMLQLTGQGHSLKNQADLLKTQQQIAKALEQRAKQDEETAKKEEREKQAAKRESEELKKAQQALELSADNHFRQLKKAQQAADRRIEQLEKELRRNQEGPQCPFCGGILPLSSSGGIKEWEKCKHCTERLVWFDSLPFKTQQDIDTFTVERTAKQQRRREAAAEEEERQRERAALEAQRQHDEAVAAELRRKEAERKQREDGERKEREEHDAFFSVIGLSSGVAATLSFDACIRACAVLVAADGVATPAELEIVRKGFGWCGLDPAELQVLFVDTCRRVLREGSEHSVKAACESLRDDTRTGGKGMFPNDLLQLLESLATCDPVDSDRKRPLFERLARSL